MAMLWCPLIVRGKHSRHYAFGKPKIQDGRMSGKELPIEVMFQPHSEHA
jgi:hypothetical protein